MGEEFADLGRQFDRSEPELVPQERTPDPIITNYKYSIPRHVSNGRYIYLSD